MRRNISSNGNDFKPVVDQLLPEGDQTIRELMNRKLLEIELALLKQKERSSLSRSG